LTFQNNQIHYERANELARRETGYSD